MVSIHCELGKSFLERWTVLSLLHQLYIQPSSLCILMVARCCNTIQDLIQNNTETDTYYQVFSNILFYFSEQNQFNNPQIPYC